MTTNRVSETRPDGPGTHWKARLSRSLVWANSEGELGYVRDDTYFVSEDGRGTQGAHHEGYIGLIRNAGPGAFHRFWVDTVDGRHWYMVGDELHDSLLQGSKPKERGTEEFDMFREVPLHKSLPISSHLRDAPEKQCGTMLVLVPIIESFQDE